MKMRITVSMTLLLTVLISHAQVGNYKLLLKSKTITELPGMQSFSFAQYNGEWLIVGGRIDGLHKRRPFEAFTESGSNAKIYVVNPSTKKVWSSSLSNLSVSLQEQLSSTNHNFYQHRDHLILVGGYGYSPTIGDHVTYDNLTSINVPQTINAIKNGNAWNSFVEQISDTLFDVTGGRLEVMNDTFYLVGGQQFEGRYNPIDPNHGPGFTQTYTEQIRKFSLKTSPLSFTHLATISDPELHRRDYNVVPQIMPNKQEGLTAFSGVFQPDVDLPFLNSIDISSKNFKVNNDFTQYYNHYHCATLPLYDSAKNEMNTLFFGGIARYYDDNGTLTQDDDVPFVKTIARVTRHSDGSMTETKMKTEMPSLLGAGSEFILNPSIATYKNHVVQQNMLQADTILIGHILGGIESTAPNVFFSNSENVSSASNTILEVYLVKSETIDIGEFKARHSQQFQVYPNPSRESIKIQFFLQKPSIVSLTLRNLKGKVMDTKQLGKLYAKTQIIDTPFNELAAGIYLITLKTEYSETTHKIIVE